MPSSVGRLFRGAAIAAAIATAAACTLLTPLDGLSDGAAPGNEAGGPSTDAAGDERAMTASDAPSEAASPLDGGDAATSSRYAAAVLADAPLLYYRFGDKSGAGARDEISGTSTPYSVSGFTFGAPGALAGDPDTAVTTTDGSGSLQLAQSADFEGFLPHSIEMWVSPSPTNTSLGFLVDHETFSGDRGGWLFRVSATDLGYERFAGDPDAAVPTSAVGAGLTAVAGQWHYVVATFDGTTVRLYLDGVRVDSGGTAVPLPKIGGTFTVGKQNCSPCSGNGYVGGMDELAIYPKALAEDRIAAHFSAAK